MLRGGGRRTRLPWLYVQSGRRGSNPRPTAWKAVALPTELRPLVMINHHGNQLSHRPLHLSSVVGGAGFEPTKAEPTDLQSAPFDRFGIPPDQNLKDPFFSGKSVLSHPWFQRKCKSMCFFGLFKLYEIKRSQISRQDLKQVRPGFEPAFFNHWDGSCSAFSTLKPTEKMCGKVSLLIKCWKLMR